MKTVARMLFAFVAALALVGGLKAADPPQELNWGQLMPPLKAEPPTKPKTFFSGALPGASSDPASADAAPPPPRLPEGEWMSRKRRQPGGNRPPRVVTTLDGKRVKIGGYVVPLDFDATTIKEFLLVPFVGACIHVPPPPPNQIVYVKAENGFEIGSMFDPVTVVGTIKTESASTGLADAGYTIDAETVELRTE